MIAPSHWILLLRLKLTLTGRAFARGRGATSLLSFIVLAAISAPAWISSATGAYLAAATLGAPGVALTLALVHLSWIGGAVLFGSFAEGFDLRVLLRYPLSPRLAFWMNVMVAPLDFIALFLILPLAAAAAGATARAGLRVGTVVAVAGMLQLCITSAVTLTLLAMLGRHVRRDWTRALLGVVLGMTVAGAGLLTTRGGVQAGQLSRLMAAGSQHVLTPSVAVARWFPGTAAPIRSVFAAFDGAWLPGSLWLAITVASLVALCEVGTRIAMREAMNREAPEAGQGDASGVKARLAGRLGAWLLPTDVALLLGRELRYFLRTPQVLVGLLTSSAFVFLLPQNQPFVLESRPLFVTMFCLVGMLNVSANQFGLDQAGVRSLFLLPVSPRRILLAKNLACVTLAFASAALCLPLLKIAYPQSDALTMITTLVALAAALPVALILGNWLSVRRPWRMTFRMGGTPPGATVAACCQLL
ncbi:MAG: type transport system permease protein, partial [Myxococcales bacterium]|nr:type transport system permease protein [Myxococcales bacterium]